MDFSPSGEVLKPILLRSATPAANEKVLNFLEGIQEAGDEVHNSPPQSIIDHDEFRSNASGRDPRSPGSQASRKLLSPAPHSKPSEGLLAELAGSAVSYGNGMRSPPQQHRHDPEEHDDVDSNVQEGRNSEPDNNLDEPGPDDNPGPFYPSHGSWGNKGPLPPDDMPTQHDSWHNPHWNQFQQAAVFSPPYQAETTLSPAAQAANVPLPVSVDPSRVASPNTERPHSRAQPSNPRSLVSHGGENGRATSPKSVKSKVTAKSRGASEHHAPPAEPRYDTPNGLPSPISSNVGSPRPHKHRPAPSISPSDSASEAHVRRSKSPSKRGASQHPGSVNGLRSPPPTSVLSGSRTQHGMAFAPFRNAPTNEDLLHAALHDRALVIPDHDAEGTKTPKAASTHPVVPPTPPRENSSKATSMISNTGRAPAPQSPGKSRKSASAAGKSPSKVAGAYHHDLHPQRVQSPASMDLNPEEERIVHEALAPSRTPRTSYYAGSTLEPDVLNTHFHDMELCLLLHQLDDPSTHEVVKRAVRKEVRKRVKKLGLRYDTEAIQQHQKAHSHHDPTSHLPSEGSNEEPPKWATDIKRELVLVQQRIESLGETVGSKIENLIPGPTRSLPAESSGDQNDYESRTPTQTVNIQTQPGTMADSMYHPVETDALEDPDQNEFYNIADRTETPPRSDYDSRPAHLRDASREDSPGHQLLEKELWRLREKRHQGSESGRSHRTWEVARSNQLDDDEHEHEFVGGEATDAVAGADEEEEAEFGEPVPTISGLPTIPDSGNTTDRREASLPPVPHEERSVVHRPQWTGEEDTQPPPWQKIHQRLLSWAMIWPLSEFDTALNSTTRGHQVDEVALSIWSTQTYKRYVRARLTDRPAGVVDRLFVPPNLADAISNAVFNGRHGVACGMLRSLWAPFGLDGMPRLLIVLAKHRNDENHWVVHKFSLPDGGLTTYDSYPERTLPDGRPLGWWFAIRVAWPDAIYPSPDHLMQKMVRLHRPTQLPIDNSVAAAGIWRNLLMGSRAERSLDLERLRDLINTEVKNLRQRKQLGKLSVGGTRPEEEIMFA